MSHEFKNGDKVLHPRKPEWGVGEVLPATKADKVVVLFTQGGMKTISPKYVQLEKYNPNENHQQSFTEGKKIRPKQITPKAPQLFKSELLYVYPPAFYKMFTQGLLVTEWKDNFPFLFDQDDEEFAIGPAGAKGIPFGPWLGSLLFYQHLQFPSIISYTLDFHKDKQKQLRSIVPPADWLQIKSWAKEFGIKALPSHLIFNRDKSNYFFGIVRFDRDKFSKEQRTVMQKIQTELGKEMHLLTLKKEGHQVHILQ